MQIFNTSNFLANQTGIEGAMGGLHKTVFKGKVEEMGSYLSSLLRTASTSVVDNKDMIEFGRVAVSSAS